MNKCSIAFLIGFVLLTGSIFTHAQVGIGTATPNSSAKLEINSTTQGFLPPRMSAAQQAAIASPAQGLVVFCTDCGTNGELQFFDGTEWRGLVVNVPAPDFQKTVYVNSTSPNTATIFDEENPPVTNNEALKADVNNIYVGTNGSTWTYKTSTATYNTYTLPLNRVVFKVRCANFPIAANTFYYVTNWTAPIHNTHPTAWNKSTGEWTAPVKGYYNVSAKIAIAANWINNSYLNFGVLKNGAGPAICQNQMRSHTTTSASMFINLSTQVYLNVGDKLRFYLQTDGTSPTVNNQSVNNEFNITLQ